MATVNIKFYSDPGHGWGAVKRGLIQDLGLSMQISYFSYQKGGTVYLEEDCDLPTVVNALKSRGTEVKWIEKNTNRNSPIRSYERYRY